jgi:acetyltransferase-like isoleucine patch superfamily enzyme
MKSKIKDYAIIIIKFIYFILNKPLAFCNYIIHQFYSIWKSSEFHTCGENFLLKFPSKIKGGKYIRIGKNFNAGKNIRIECWDKYNQVIFYPELIIGDNVCMNNNVHIGCIRKVHIGNNVLFASNIYISDHFHGYIDERDINIPPTDRNLFSKGPVIIEDDVWIGENVSIMPNLTIGKGCIIGANSVVTKDSPEYCVLVGAPAKIIRILNKNEQ